MHRHPIFTAFLAGLIATLLTAQQCPLQIGTNLSGPCDWSAEWPFADIMKYSRQWITCNSEWVEGGQNPWDTEVLDQIPLDENGYPLQLPWPVDGQESAQMVRTVWANTAALKEGNYVVLYDGEGEIAMTFDAVVISSTPGRIEFRLKNKDNIMALEIRESRPENHIRNIRVLMPGTESTYGQHPWCDEWLEKLEPFKALRFMDWGLTNNSRLEHWEDRPEVNDFSYTLNGVPYEWMIDICNFKQADAWICIPHQADDNYVRNLARLFRNNLDPALTLYIEYSNEIWNWMFDQTHYLFGNGDQNEEWPERIVPFIQHVMDIFTEEFTGDMERIVRVVGVQTSWQDVSNRIVFTMRPGSFDAFAVTSYFGFTETGYDSLEALGSGATAENVLALARDALLNDSLPWIRRQHQTISQAHHIPMIYYEGGQHLTPRPFGTVQPYNQALMDAQTHPGMYDLYTEVYDSLQSFMMPDESALLMNFSFISNKDGQYGSWGVLESQFHQFPPYRDIAPKYQAILDRICTPAAGTDRTARLPDAYALFPVHPNPLNGTASVRFILSAPGHVRLAVFNMRGQRVTTLTDQERPAGEHMIRWDSGNLPSGLYVIRLQTDLGIIGQKCMLIR